MDEEEEEEEAVEGKNWREVRIAFEEAPSEPSPDHAEHRMAPVALRLLYWYPALFRKGAGMKQIQEEERDCRPRPDPKPAHLEKLRWPLLQPQLPRSR
jgi:hypothetical protein